MWGLLASFFIGNVMLLVLNLPLAPVFAQILRIPYGYMYPLILLTSFVGAYSIDNNMFSVWLVLVFGVIGYFMKRLRPADGPARARPGHRVAVREDAGADLGHGRRQPLHRLHPPPDRRHAILAARRCSLAARLLVLSPPSPATSGA